MATPISQLQRSSPENVIKAPKGSIFTRNGNNFYLSVNGVTTKLDILKRSFALEYQNEIWYPSLTEDTITFSTTGETWAKRGSGDNKKGWVQLSSNSSTIVRRIILPVVGNVRGVAAGYYSSYILNTSDELWATGDNENGQLGFGYNSYRESASLSLTNVKLAAASCEGWFAGAVKNDNTLWFTGYGGDGQFGNGTNDTYSSWTENVLSGDITGSGTITNLVAGEYYTALHMSNGTVWAASTETMNINSNTYIQIASDVKQISGGGYHLLYVKNDNTLWGIGDNWDLQLGNLIQPYFYWDSPYQIASNVDSCAAMGYHSAYIDTDGDLYTFGANWNGQLGTWYGYDDFDVAEPQRIATGVKFVTGGDSTTFYIKNDNTLYGMGYSGNGELGNGNWNDVIEPVFIDGNVTDVVGGQNHTLYIKSDKTLYGMGYNYQWQLTEDAYPFAMYYTDGTGWTTEGITKFKFNANWDDEIYWRDAIYANGKFIAGGGEGITRIRYSSDGKTWLTGSIQDVQAGISGIAYNGTDTYVAVSEVSDAYNDGRPEVFTSTDGINWVTGSLNNTGWRELRAVSYLNDEFIAVGDQRIVTSSNGTDWAEQTGAFPGVYEGIAYGNGKYVLATGWGDYAYNANKNLFTQTFDNRTANAVSTGESHVLLLKDGTLYGCGYNGDGQLGLNSTLDGFIYFQPVATNVRSVACGEYHTTFVKNDNTLWGMGANYYTQLGDGTFIQRNAPVQIDTNVSQSFAGMWAYYNTVYLKTNGELWGMGSNSQGQLGAGSNNYESRSIYLDSNVRQAAIGDAYILYVKNDDTLWAMGNNGYGQFGTGNYNSTNTPVQIASDVKSCTVGAITSYYITTDNTLYGMGYNGNGQLGIGGDTSNQVSPVAIDTNVSKVSAGYNVAHYIKTDNTLYAMGSNGYGQFGIGNNDSSNTPTLVTGSVKDVSCGNYFTYMIAQDNKVYSTGTDNYGRLGLYNLASKGMYSTDASTWYTSSMPDYYWNDIAFGNGRFVTVADDDNLVASSTDGVNWTVSYVSTSSYASYSNVIFDGTKFVASTWYSDAGEEIVTSTDGITWTKTSTGYNQYWGALAYGGGKYVLLSYGWNDYVNPQAKLHTTNR